MKKKLWIKIAALVYVFMYLSRFFTIIILVYYIRIQLPPIFLYSLKHFEKNFKIQKVNERYSNALSADPDIKINIKLQNFLFLTVESIILLLLFATKIIKFLLFQRKT